jgi:hypothetical protein
MTSKEIDLDALEKAALAASPGPWEYAEDKYVNRRVQTVGGKPDYVVWPYEATCVSEEDGAYIAAANPAVVLELIRRLREAESELAGANAAVAEARANDMTAMRWLADARFASGDNGKRMLPEFVEYLKELRTQADRYEKVRKLHPMEYQLLYHRNLKGEASFDDLIDAYKIGEN